MKKLLLISLTLASFAACKNSNTAKDEAFKAFEDRFIEAYWKANPTSALYSGYHKYDTVLQVPDEAYFAEQAAFYNAYKDSLKSFDVNVLSDNNKTDYYMLQGLIESELWYMSDFKSHTWNPSSYNLGGSFAQILTEDFAPLEERIATFATRLRNVGAYYAAARKNISNPTLEHTDLAIQQNIGAVDVFTTMLNDSLKVLNQRGKLGTIDIAQVKDAATKSVVAINGYVKWLQDTLKPSMKGKFRDFRIGKTLYDKKFELDIVSGYSAEQIYEKALKRKDELHKEMAKIGNELWSKYYGSKAKPVDSKMLVKALIDTISRTHVHRDSFIPAVKKQIPELVSFINGKNIIYLDPAKPLVVRETPKYMQGVAGASISAPGPYEKDANTYYNVTPLTEYSPEAAESYLREYNYFTLQILNIHEAIPGHYTQLVYSNQSPSLVKSLFGNGAMVEGWAVYTERMMLEEGYGNNQPELWLMYYKWHMRVVCNTILDHSIHVKDMGKEAAMNLLMNEAFQERSEAEGKWKRATLSQVQLCSYFTGYSEIYDLREEWKKKQGNEFDLKKFHEKFLSYGSAPVKYIKMLMEK